MQANAYSKYVLRDLHEAIDLFDRKIDYCQTLEKFDSADEREKAVQKLVVKRGSLVKTALALTALGVESGNSFLPRSFKTVDADSSEPIAVQPVVAAGKRRRAAGR